MYSIASKIKFKSIKAGIIAGDCFRCRSTISISLLFVLLFSYSVKSQVLISNGNTITENFTGYFGTSTFPANWDMLGTGSSYNYRGTAQTSGLAGGWYGYNNMSFLGSSNAKNGTATWKLQNVTGQGLSGFRLAFNAKLWRSQSASPTVRVYYQVSSSATFPAIGTTGWTEIPVCAFNEATANVLYSLGGADMNSGSVTASIANNQYLYIRWVHPGDANSDNLGWDDISFFPTLSIPTSTLGAYLPQLSGSISTLGAPSNVPLAGFYISPSTTADFNSVTITGTLANIADVTSVRVFRDFNGDGIINSIGGTDASVSGAGVAFVNGNFTISLSGETSVSSTRYYLIVANISNPASSSSVGVQINSFSTSLTTNVGSMSLVTRPLINGQVTAVTDYFRSYTDGDWNVPATWESSSDNINWTVASLVPDYRAAGITIQNGHSISIVSAVTTDKTVVASGGVLKLLHNSTNQFGVITLNNGGATDELTIQNGAVFQIVSVNNQYSSGLNYQTSGNINVNSGGKITVGDGNNTHNSSGWSSLGQETSAKVIWNNASVFEWNTTSTATLSSSNVTFFPSATTTVIPTLRYSASSVSSFGASTSTLINGLFEVNANITFINSGTKTFRNGIVVTSGVTLTQSSGSGLINIGSGSTADAASFGGGGTIALNSNGLGIQANCSASMVDNITVNAGPLTVNNSGSLLTGSSPTYNISGTSSFTLSSGASISIGSADGISSSGATGNIQTTTRSFNAGANYIYYGSVAQNTGNGLPSTLTANLTINNGTGVSLSQATSSSGTVTLTAGTFTTSSANLLTVTNTSNTAILGASVTNYVNGPLAWALSGTTATYIFPTGKGGNYYPLTIGAYIGSATPIVEAFASAPSGSYTAGCSVLNEYWSVNYPTGSSIGTPIIKLQRPGAIVTGIEIGATSSAGGNGTYTSLGGSISGAGPYLITATTNDASASAGVIRYYSIMSPTSVGGVINSGAAQSICSGQTPADLVLSGNIGNVVQWEKSSTSTFSSGTVTVISNTSTTLTGASIGALTATTYFQALVKSGECNSTYSSIITVTVNPYSTASVSIASSDADNIICSGTSVTFTATPTNGGLTPSFQWYVGSTAVGTNSNTYTTNALANNDAVSLLMTSNATGCLSGSPATSNSIITAVNANLSASVSITSSDADNIFCSGTSITFTATPTNGGSAPSYQWYIGSTPVGTNSNTYVTTTLANTNQVKVVMTSNATGCITGSPATSNIITNTVNTLPTATFTATPAANYCASLTATAITYTTQSGMTNYQWTIPGTLNTDYNITGGSAATTSNTVSIRWLTGGSKTVNVKYTNSSGCTTAAGASATTTVYSGGYVTSGQTQTICSGSTPSDMTITGYNGTIARWEKSTSSTFPSPTTIANTSSTLSGATVGALTSTTYFRAVITNSATLCTSYSLSYVTVTVNPKPTPGITNNTAGSPTVLNCTTTSISVTATGGATYSWSNGASVVATTAGLSITAAGTYTVTVSGANSCTATSSITISSNTTAPSVGITNNTAGSPTELNCTTTSISVTATGGNAYSWSNSLGTNASQILNSSGVYTVTATGTNGCTATSSITITTNTTSPAATISPSGPTTICGGGSVTLTSSSGSSYSWSTGATSSAITVNSSGSYSVIVTGANGCTAQSAATTVSVTSSGTWIGETSSDWNTASNWSCSSIPNSAMDVVIPSGTTFSPSIITTNASCKNLTVNSGATLTMTGSFSLVISGSAFTNNGTFVAGTANVFFNQPIVISGTIAFNNVFISNSVNFGSGSTINGSLNINSGGYISINAPRYGSLSKLIYNSGGVFYRNLEWNTDNAGTNGSGYPNNIIVQNNTTLQLNSTSYPANFALGCSGNFTIDAGSSVTTDSMLYPISIAGNLILNGSITLSRAVDKNLFIGGNFTRSSTGIFNHNDRAVVFNGSSNSVITASGGQYFPYLYLSKSSTTNTLTLADSISIGKDFTINSGKFYPINKDVTLLSNATATARFGKVGFGSDVVYTGSGRFNVERYIPTGSASGQHAKSWQFLAIPTTGDNQTIRAAWQEGATTPNGNPKPGFGTQITSNLGTTIAGARTLGFDTLSIAGPSMKTYDKVTSLWVGVPSTISTPIFNKKGYMVYVRGDRSITGFSAVNNATPTTLRTRGKLFSPSIIPPNDTIPAGKTESIGNPYASQIDFVNLLLLMYSNSDTLPSTFYVWDPLLNSGAGGYQNMSAANGDFLPNPGGTANYPTGRRCTTIQSGQAFFVKNNAASEVVVPFDESVKIDTNSRNTFRIPYNHAADRQYFRATIHAGTNESAPVADGTVVAFSSTFSNNFDNNDALKILNSSENMGILSKGKLLSVEAKSFVSRTDTVFINLTGLKNITYQLRFAPENMPFIGLDIVLVDQYLRTQQMISASDSSFVNFTVTTDINSRRTDRFYIVFKKQFSSLPISVLTETAKSFEAESTSSLTEKNNSATSNVENAKIILYPNPSVNKKTILSFSNAAIGNYRLKLINNLGQLVKEENLTIKNASFNKETNLSGLPQGTYHLELSGSGGVIFTEQLIVQ